MSHMVPVLESIAAELEHGLDSRNIHGIRAAARRALQMCRDAHAHLRATPNALPEHSQRY